MIIEKKRKCVICGDFEGIDRFPVACHDICRTCLKNSYNINLFMSGQRDAIDKLELASTEQNKKLIKEIGQHILHQTLQMWMSARDVVSAKQFMPYGG